MENKFLAEPKKKMPIFNSIEEYESYLNDTIKDSLSVFLNIVKDIDLFKKMISLEDIKKNGEVNISPHLEALFLEMKTSQKVIEKIENNLRAAAEDKSVAKKERKRVHYYFSKENGTNLAVTEFLNPFQQREIPNDLMQPRYFSKKTEMKLINTLICLKIRKVVHDKFGIAFEEGIENERWTKDGTEIQKNEDTPTGTEEQKYFSTIMRRKIINDTIKRLYPEPLVKDNINDQFYVDKINEFHYNGQYLTKKVNFKNLYKELKLKPKEDYKGNPINDIKLADDIIKGYYDDKNKDKNGSSSLLSKKDEISYFKRGDLYFDKKDLLITKSKMYIKVDRKEKDKDFKLKGEPLDSKSLFFN